MVDSEYVSRSYSYESVPIDTFKQDASSESDSIHIFIRKLLKLLNEELDIKDDPNAKDLIVTDGEIVFDDVHFAYDARQEALKGISFTIPKGASVALVGESGSSSSFMLIYRVRMSNTPSHLEADEVVIRRDQVPANRPFLDCFIDSMRSPLAAFLLTVKTSQPLPKPVYVRS